MSSENSQILYKLTVINEDLTNYKLTILFISGYKKENYWNTTEHGKTIDIMNSFCITARLIHLDITDAGYKLPVPELCDMININENYIIISHSYGSFYAQYLAYKDKNVKGMVLLDPTISNEIYKKYLENKEDDPNIKEKKDNFDKLPNLNTLKNISAKVIIEVHLVINNELINKCEYFASACSKNMLSSIEVHNCSHMIHYDKSQIVIQRIKRLIKNLGRPF
jgi:hypothetical protein